MSALKKPLPFGKYYLLERINVGGMAEVFKAKTFGVEGFERLLAVKRILPNIAEDEEFITMFIDEAKIAVQLQHANIAQIFDLGKVDDSFFIALEYVHGRDVRSIFDRMRSRGEVVPIAMACYIVMQVCEGLDYAHNKRDGQGRELHLVHRDISPQNVLIGYEGEVKLIDFGIAKAAGKASKTQAGILKGKFGYMSPEQVRGLPIDRRSDIFAVGIVLYELLTGERLFVGESDFSTLEKVRNVEIMPPSSYNKKIPPELERLVLKALARDPEDRYSNAIDLHDDLQSFLYSIGEFYSRKDLSAWMKKTFAVEIEEDNAKLEQYRQIAAPVAASPEGSRRSALAGTGMSPSRTGGAAPTRPAPASAGASPSRSPSQKMGWDDEELDTQIFDKEITDPQTAPQTADQAADRAAAELFFEDDDRTVANEPPPDILEQARQPNLLVTPKPRPAPTRPPAHEEVAATPPPIQRRPPRRPTLAGMPVPNLPVPAGRPPLPQPSPATTPPPMVAATGGAPTGGAPTGGRKSVFNLPAVGLPPVVASAAPPPASPPLPPPAPARIEYPPPGIAPFGTGSFADEIRRQRPKRGGLYAGMAVAVLAVIAGAGAWYYTTTNRPGRIELSMAPADATVLIDNAKVGDHSPVTVERPPGPYTLSVIRDGYVRSDQNIELRAGQPLPLSITLEPSPDTGFELTSDPPGGLVWLDGLPIKGAEGKQARTDFRAFRIAPGQHVLEIKGENRFKPWRQDVEIDPGSIRKVHALLIPAGGGAAGGAPDAKASAPAHPEVAVAPPAPRAHRTEPSSSRPQATPPPPSAPPEAAAPAPAPTHRASSPAGGGRKRPREVASGDDGAAASPEDDGKESAKVADGAGGDCSITVNSTPWSEVWIDGKNTTKHTPFVDYKIPCGKHRLAFKRSDMQIDYSENITVHPGEKFKQRYTLATDE
jgi:serine/threonine protein kinase